jgi:hypothetical protein
MEVIDTRSAVHARLACSVAGQRAWTSRLSLTSKGVATKNARIHERRPADSMVQMGMPEMIEDGDR